MPCWNTQQLVVGTGTAVAKEAWREASAEEAGWAKELQQVRAAIKAAEAEESKNEVGQERPKRSPQGSSMHERGTAAYAAVGTVSSRQTETVVATPTTRDEAAAVGVKWSDVGTPAEVLEKKLKKYRAKMNSPKLSAAKRNEYLGKIKLYAAKAAELERESGTAAKRSGAERIVEAVRQGSSRSDVGSVGPDANSALSRRAGLERGHAGSVRPNRSPSMRENEDSGWKVGDRCHAGTVLGDGTVRFVGQCLELAKGKGSGASSALWAGVELDLPRGKHDGYVLCFAQLRRRRSSASARADNLDYCSA